MVAFLAPVIAIVAGGALVTGAGIGIHESRKSAAAEAAAKKTGDALYEKVQEHLSSGALYPAFRAHRKYIDHMLSHFNVSPQTQQESEDAYTRLRNTALKEYRRLHNEYHNDASAVVSDEEGGALYKIQHDYITKLENLLGKEAPKIKALEDSFGINYRIHKYGFATN